MTNLSDIITPSNVLTVDNTKTVSNKTISGASNTINNLDASNLSSGTVATARLASGTADSTTYLRGDQTWAQGGLQYFTETESTTGVNASVPVNALIVANANTNVDVALSQKGSGAVLAHIPDGTTTGGNKRGTNAVDWQTSRSSATNVASGAYSVISGGSYNTAAGSYATVVGGQYNSASNTYAIAGGYFNSALSSYTTVLGYNSVATNTGAVAIGRLCRADGSYSSALGTYGDTRSRVSTLVMGSTSTAAIYGASQASIMQVGANTTDATPTVLTASAVSTSYVYQNRMDANSAYAFKIMLIAAVTGAGDTKAWELTGCIKRGSSGVPILVGAVAKTVIAADTGAATWDCDIVIDTDAFTVQATGQAATTIRWSASIHSSELGF